MGKKDKTEETLERDEILDQEEQYAKMDDSQAQDDTHTELEQYKEDLQKEKDKFLRLFAEFENYKKRTSKERMDFFKTANQDVMVAMLPVLDDFDRAMQEIGKAKDKELIRGVELISNKLRETLRAKGLQIIGTKEGDVFDPEIHEAITQIPAPTPKMKGKIVDVIEKGYKLGERIIRYPRVVIGQ